MNEEFKEQIEDQSKTSCGKPRERENKRTQQNVIEGNPKGWPDGQGNSRPCSGFELGPRKWMVGLVTRISHASANKLAQSCKCE